MFPNITWWCSHCLLIDNSTSSCCQMLLAKGALGLVSLACAAESSFPCFLSSFFPNWTSLYSPREHDLTNPILAGR